MLLATYYCRLGGLGNFDFDLMHLGPIDQFNSHRYSFSFFSFCFGPRRGDFQLTSLCGKPPAGVNPAYH